MAIQRQRSTLLWVGVIILVLIGTASVIRRAIFLKALLAAGHAISSSPMDVGFAQHPLLTIMHITPGLLFMLFSPFQFVERIRQGRPRLHRWMGRFLLVDGGIVAISALWMGFIMPIGGPNESAAIAVFASLFLFALWNAFRHIRRCEFAEHREWMIRGFALALAVSTVRPIVGVFFATSRFTHLTPHEFFGTAFWLGFTLQLIAAEVYIRRRSGSALA